MKKKIFLAFLIVFYLNFYTFSKNDVLGAKDWLYIYIKYNNQKSKLYTVNYHYLYSFHLSDTFVYNLVTFKDTLIINRDSLNESKFNDLLEIKIDTLNLYKSTLYTNVDTNQNKIILNECFGFHSIDFYLYIKHQYVVISTLEDCSVILEKKNFKKIFLDSKVENLKLNKKKTY